MRVWCPRAFMVLLLTRVPSPCALAVRRAMDVVRKQPAARGERELERLCVWERGCVCELEREAGVGRVCGLEESRACLCGREREAYAWLCAAFARAGWLACVQAQRWPAHGRRALFYSELSLLLLCVCVSQVAWRKLETTLSGRDVAYVAVDGASSPPVRKALWEISGKREYPQVFLPSEGGAHTFAGGMDDIQEVSPRLPTSDVTHTPPPVVCMGWP